MQISLTTSQIGGEVTGWREAADHVLATVTIEILRANGDPDNHWLVIEEPDDVAREIEQILPA